MGEADIRGKEIIGKIVVSGETGRKYGIVGDLSFITESGELMNLSVVEPTKHIAELDLERDDKGRLLVPFTAVKAVDEFVIIAEKEIV
jgi:sporulation protein YlmC with PRC-barrel domain